MDVIRKRTGYARAGVAEPWLVDPEERAVFVLRLPEEQRDRAEHALAAELGADDVLSSPLLEQRAPQE